MARPLVTAAVMGQESACLLYTSGHGHGGSASAGHAAHNRQPVSYTHLDVYKRQGLILDLLLKYQLLSALPEEIRREALLCFPLVARYSQVQLTVRARRARQDGLGSVFIGGVGNSQLVIAAATAMILSVLLLGAPGLVISGGACLCTWGMKVWSHRRLGGITGDVIGCVSELNELLCLLMLVAWAGTGRYL